MPYNLIIWRQVCALGMRLFIAFMYIVTEAELLSLLWQKILFPFLWNPYLKSLIHISYSILRILSKGNRINNIRCVTEGGFPESLTE